MKTLVIIICMVLIGLKGYCQRFDDYLVRGIPIPIQEKPIGNILIRVPVNEMITDITYSKELDCFFGRYKETYGSISSMWLPEYHRSLKDRIYPQYQDSASIAKFTDKSLFQGYRLPPEGRDTMVYYQNVTIY
jgi:hypothetical protein